MKKTILFSLMSLLFIAMISCKTKPPQDHKSAITDKTEEDTVLSETDYDYTKEVMMDLPPPEESEPNKSLPDDSLIFTIVEDQPEFPGGNDSLKAYIKRNIQYPKEALEKGIEGTVFVTFIVEKDGSVSGVQVLRGIGKGCDKEAMRVIRNMPRWKPGYQRGNPVRVKYHVPIRFKLPAE